MIPTSPDDRLAATAIALGLEVHHSLGWTGRFFVYPGTIMGFAHALDAAHIRHTQDVDPELGMTVSILGLVVENSEQRGGLGGVLIRDGPFRDGPFVLVREPGAHDEDPGAAFTPEERAQVSRRIQADWEAVWGAEDLEEFDQQLRDVVQETLAATAPADGSSKVTVGAAQCWSNAAFPPLPATTDMTAMKEKVLRDYTEPPINSTETTIGECEACGRRRPIQEVKDPFMNEGTIDDDGSMRRWCYPCYSQRCDEMR